MLRECRDELRPMLALALPVILGELGWMAMGVVDTLMVGRLGAEAIGGVSIGRMVFLTIGVSGTGLMLGLDTLVAQAHGRGDREDGRRSLTQALYLSLQLTVLISAVFLLSLPLIGHLGLDPAVAPLAVDYLQAVLVSLLPLLLFTAFRRYLQARGLVWPVMVALISANLVNACFNWVLIFGKLGAPALGVGGAGWASCASMTYMALFLAVAVRLRHRRDNDSFAGTMAYDRSRLRRLLALGLPASSQSALEFGVFAVATILAGRLHPAALAAHHIALTAAGVTYMIPLGISSAAAVRVGHAVGRRDPSGVGRAGWTALLLGAAFMFLASLMFVAVPRFLIGWVTSEEAVVTIGVSLLYVAAIFQLADGTQIIATGALRGVGDTRTPLVVNLVGHWLVGLPVGWYLTFGLGWGVAGLWVGLSLGLIVVGLFLLAVWHLRVREFQQCVDR